MAIKASILADSLAPCGARLTTFLLTYPRFIHSEVLTHRALSRNSASTRAIPAWKSRSAVWHDPAMPVFWGADGRGMVAKKKISSSREQLARWVWLASSKLACLSSWLLSRLGVHKQIACRVTEPFSHMTTLASATDWGNFFALRCAPDAQPEFQSLASEMLRVYLLSEPRRLSAGDWHLPYIRDGEELPSALLLKIVCARAARLSYLNFNGEFDIADDCRLHDQLVAAPHASPLEHAARAESELIRSGNFVGFTQYRKLIPNECRSPSRVELEALLKAGAT